MHLQKGLEDEDDPVSFFLAHSANGQPLNFGGLHPSAPNTFLGGIWTLKSCPKYTLSRVLEH